MPKVQKTTKPAQEPKTNGSPSPASDLYDEDLSQVKTSLPLLREDAYKTEIARFEATQSQDGKYTFHTLVMKTLEKARDTEGKEQNAGYPLRFRVVQDNAETDLSEVKRGLAKMTQAAGVRTPNDLVPGLKLLCHTRNSRETTKNGRTFEAQTEVRKLSPLK